MKNFLGGMIVLVLVILYIAYRSGANLRLPSIPFVETIEKRSQKRNARHRPMVYFSAADRLDSGELKSQADLIKFFAYAEHVLHEDFKPVGEDLANITGYTGKKGDKFDPIRYAHGLRVVGRKY